MTTMPKNSCTQMNELMFNHHLRIQLNNFGIFVFKIKLVTNAQKIFFIDVLLENYSIRSLITFSLFLTRLFSLFIYFILSNNFI